MHPSLPAVWPRASTTTTRASLREFPFPQTWGCCGASVPLCLLSARFLSLPFAALSRAGRCCGAAPCGTSYSPGPEEAGGAGRERARAVRAVRGGGVHCAPLHAPHARRGLRGAALRRRSGGHRVLAYTKHPRSTKLVQGQVIALASVAAASGASRPCSPSPTASRVPGVQLRGELGDCAFFLCLGLAAPVL